MNKSKTKNVFVWGAFDILHEGHFKLFEEASKMGDLNIIVLPDERMKEVKKLANSEDERKASLIKTGCAKNVFVDALPELKCFADVEPHIFCFGYDQNSEWTEKIKSHISERFPNCKFAVMDKYSDIHSSDLRKSYNI